MGNYSIINIIICQNDSLKALCLFKQGAVTELLVNEGWEKKEASGLEFLLQFVLGLKINVCQWKKRIFFQIEQLINEYCYILCMYLLFQKYLIN